MEVRINHPAIQPSVEFADNTRNNQTNNFFLYSLLNIAGEKKQNIGHEFKTQVSQTGGLASTARGGDGIDGSAKSSSVPINSCIRDCTPSKIGIVPPSLKELLPVHHHRQRVSSPGASPRANHSAIILAFCASRVVEPTSVRHERCAWRQRSEGPR